MAKQVAPPPRELPPETPPPQPPSHPPGELFPKVGETSEEAPKMVSVSIEELVDGAPAGYTNSNILYSKWLVTVLKGHAWKIENALRMRDGSYSLGGLTATGTKYIVFTKVFGPAATGSDPPTNFAPEQYFDVSGTIKSVTGENADDERHIAIVIGNATIEKTKAATETPSEAPGDGRTQ